MATGLQMQSTLLENGTLEMALASVEVPTPADHEVVVRVEAAPINPSDHGVMFGPANVAESTSSGSGAETVFSAPVAAAFMPRF